MSDRIDRIIVFSLALLAFLAGISFALTPAYSKGVDMGMNAVANCLSAALGAKFGLSLPKGDQ